MDGPLKAIGEEILNEETFSDTSGDPLKHSKKNAANAFISEINAMYFSKKKKKFIHSKRNPRALIGEIGRKDIVGFILSILRSIIPVALLGCYANFKRMLKKVKSFILLNKGETLSLAMLMHGMRIAACWKEISSDASSSTSIPSSMCGKMRHNATLRKAGYLSRILFFIFTHLVVPILRAHFYATECETTSHRIRFFRKIIWNRMQIAAEKQFIKSNFVQNEENEDKFLPTAKIV
ncbi:Rna-directed Dna polymerase, partial [Cardiosporidium cionae]